MAIPGGSVVKALSKLEPTDLDFSTSPPLPRSPPNMLTRTHTHTHTLVHTRTHSVMHALTHTDSPPHSLSLTPSHRQGARVLLQRAHWRKQVLQGGLATIC